MKSSKIMWLVWFIASFAAFHYGMMAFGLNLLDLPVLSKISRIVMIIFGLCGLISIITLLGSCSSECKP